MIYTFDNQILNQDLLLFNFIHLKKDLQIIVNSFATLLHKLASIKLHCLLMNYKCK